MPTIGKYYDEYKGLIVKREMENVDMILINDFEGIKHKTNKIKIEPVDYG